MEEIKTKSQFPAMEEEVLSFWQENKIFEQSVNKEAPQGDYVFYDGPPFATGTVHHGHLVANLIKDVVPRFWTMQGYRVERKWGWDCHGLPIENIIEKDLGFQTKKDIIAYGIDKFNAACRERVLEYADDWEKTITRWGRWVDMTNPYRTMDLNYMESVWSVFKKLYDKGLIYEGYRSMYVCPRCETTLSQSEVAEGYRDIKDLSAIAKFELIDEPGTLVLAWTTTPWTLPGNVALAVGKDINYVKVEILGEDFENWKKGEKYIFSTSYFETFNPIVKGYEEGAGARMDYKIYLLQKLNNQEVKLHSLNSRDLIGKKYQPLFDYYAKDQALKNHEQGWQIYPADFVTTEDGTGVVHIAPGFGEDDLNLSKEFNLPFVQHVGMNGIIKNEVVEFAGLHVKPAEDLVATDLKVIRSLSDKGLLFNKAKYEHSYPHCWRCDTPLINYATGSWFVKVTDIKPRALETAKDINWSPEHIKEGRFGQWLSGARDWSISRQRFWASCLPIWKCQACPNLKVLGSIAELEELSGQKITDLHKDALDPIEFACTCGAQMKRIPDVLDCWFESGSMPYAQLHYPFENQAKFEANFPAKFIAEGQDQTRTWFYYLHIISNGLFDKHAFENVIVNGIVLAEDGKKMSKKLKNYPDPNEVLSHYGADALRMYLLSSPVMQAENLSFSSKGVEESLRKNVMLLWNIYKFYETYATDAVSDNQPNSANVLDQWLLARLNELVTEVTESMLAYDLPRSTRPITRFIDDFSTWYLRRSRDRFKGEDKDQALAVTGYALKTLSRVLAPFMPFAAETLWQKLSAHNFADSKESVHLQTWPVASKVNDKVLRIMDSARVACRLGLSARDIANIKVRQPLSMIYLDVKGLTFQDESEYEDEIFEIIKDELNVKGVEKINDSSERAVDRDRGIVDVVWHDKPDIKQKHSKDKDGDNFVSLVIDLSPELIAEGLQRDLIRAINNLRKNANLTILDSVTVYINSLDEDIIKIINDNKNYIMHSTLSSDILIKEYAENVLIEEKN